MNKLLLTLTTIIFLVVGCNKEKSDSTSTPTSTTGEAVKILNSSPALTETLKVGQKVKLSIDVEYTLSSSDSGSIALVVQDASNGLIRSEMYVAQKGTHKEKLEAEITVPDTRAVVIFTPLAINPSSGATVLETQSYKVIK
jgi:hypothetical protein